MSCSVTHVSSYVRVVYDRHYLLSFARERGYGTGLMPSTRIMRRRFLHADSDTVDRYIFSILGSTE